MNKETRICKKCGDSIPYSIWVEGQKKKIVNRRYCLKCSPFGKHNTRSLEKYPEYFSEKDKRGSVKKGRVCPECGRQHFSKSNLCASCIFKSRRKERVSKLYEIVGTECWLCGYDKGMAAQNVMDFHHVKNKSFGLTAREITNYSWDRVWEEVRKCTSICCRCHREFNAGLINESEMEKVFLQKWEEIDANNQNVSDLFDKPSNSVDRLTVEEKIAENRICKGCGKILSGKTKLGLCVECYSISERKVERPSKEELAEMLTNKESMCSIGRKYGVSNTAVKKWAKRYGII